jgi:hypothetical protein
MGRRPVEVDLPETRNLVRRLARRQEPERSIAFNVFFECKLGTGHQAHGNTRVRRISKAARDGIGKLC